MSQSAASHQAVKHIVRGSHTRASYEAHRLCGFVGSTIASASQAWAPPRGGRPLPPWPEHGVGVAPPPNTTHALGAEGGGSCSAQHLKHAKDAAVNQANENLGDQQRHCRQLRRQRVQR